ncbi:18449_t:CDS:2 [Funneliformis geosporum]|uniref:18449_t:CDS:1 n=1 Tax=Funneliformis geosporum TaxID=1117311 RepID=A0A9W4SS95_9GLOM|nr:18449_t:CDS:2 [Funneliformis geosporum]
MCYLQSSALMISKSESIIHRLKNEYPNLTTLMEYNREGTIGFLKANGGVKAIDPQSGVERKFKEELRQARKLLTNEIHDTHFIRFPYWPTVEEGEQESSVELDTGSVYDTGAYSLV